MPRKTACGTRPTVSVPGCFNEAAARCRGKPGLLPGVCRVGAAASMRPRPDAAENLQRRVSHLEVQVASMRPRPDAAENQSEQDGDGGELLGFNEAAARCRGKPAEAKFLVHIAVMLQ